MPNTVGHEAERRDVAEPHGDRGGQPWWRHPVLRSALLSGAVTSTAFVLAHTGSIGGELERLLYMLAIPLGAYHWAREALEELWEERAIGIDMLMLSATAASAALGLWDEAAWLVFLYGSAEGLEEYTYARTRAAIRGLLDLTPQEAHVLRGGQEVAVPAEALRPGDRFVVRPGERVATDGVVRAGRSSVDESPVTGESIPVDKALGAAVFAGTLNRQGALEVEATAAFVDNTLAKIVHLVEAAQAQKGRAQQWIERFGRRYSPIVLAASVLLVVVPWLAGLPLGPWSKRAVVLLVAAAPCALVMSMPVAMAAGITRAGRRGILVKGGAHLEHLGAVRVVAFDKTGTLTEGRPAVTDVIGFARDEDAVLEAAAAVERLSEHPLARAIVEAARARGIEPPQASDFEALAGAGARAVVGDEPMLVGNLALFRQRGADVSAAGSRVEELQANGKTVVLVGTDTHVYGIVALADRLRPEARDIVTRLRGLGVHVAMLTGDNERTARTVATSVGIDDVRAGLKPNEKVAAVRQLEGERGHVLMVGDGVNDAPALAAATCGVAMGVAGSDAAIEAADVALMADDLGKVEEALRLGRRALRISRQNIVFSVAILVAMVPTAVLGVWSVAAAVLVHEVSELLAVANGLRVARDDARDPWRVG